MNYVFVAVFLALMLVISFICVRRVKNLDDFYLGGRNVGPWLSAMAYGTAYFSAVIFVGYAGKLGWNFGTAAIWIGIGNAFIGTWLAWKVMAPKTREITQRLGVSTMPEFLNVRYGSKALKILCAIVIFVFLTPYCASVYQGLGMMVETALHIPYEWAVVIMTIITGIYVVAGGYIANAMTGMVQGIIMLIGAVLIFIFAFSGLGGLGNALTALTEIDAAKTTLLGADPMGLFWLIMLTSVGVWGLPQMVHKFYAIKSEKDIKYGRIISTVFSLVVGGIAYFVGAFGPVALHNTLPEAGYDAVIPTMMNALMPEAMIGLIVVMLLAASMSTLASLVMSSSSAIAMDLLKGTLTPKWTEKKTTRCMRWLVVLFMVISVVIALLRPALIVNLMGFSWGTVAGVCLGPFVLGVLWKRANAAGAWAGAISALLVTLIFSLLPEYGMAQSPMIGVLAMAASLVFTVVGSLVTKPMSEVHLQKIFSVQNPKNATSLPKM